MIASIFTSIIAYISTNIDDIFVIMILLAQTVKGTKGKLVAGHFLGVGIITVVSMLGAFGLQYRCLYYLMKSVSWILAKICLYPCTEINIVIYY